MEYLSDSSKFAELVVADEKQPDILVNLEKQITDLKKQLKDLIKLRYRL